MVPSIKGSLIENGSPEGPPVEPPLSSSEALLGSGSAVAVGMVVVVPATVSSGPEDSPWLVPPEVGDQVAPVGSRPSASWHPLPQRRGQHRPPSTTHDANERSDHAHAEPPLPSAHRISTRPLARAGSARQSRAPGAAQPTRPFPSGSGLGPNGSLRT